jgi:hypothetical protein
MILKGKQTEAQKKRVATAICDRVEDSQRPIDVGGSEWYPKITILRKA